jgi:hypothetical protein
MISFSDIMRKVLTERMSFSDLYNNSTPDRVDRSKNVNARSLRVTSMGGQEAWTFTYKSNPSTTGHRWHGYVRFLNEDVSQAQSADQLDCMVDCDCPDYRYRWAYNNNKQGAGALGSDSWNMNNGRAPRPISQGGVGDQGPGMCKHLIALGEFLKTNIEPEAPQPDEPATKAPAPTQKAPTKPQPKPQPKPQVKAKVPAAQKPQTINAPKPEDDTYSDSRGDTLQEGNGHLADRLTALVQSKPEFDVYYED